MSKSITTTSNTISLDWNGSDVDDDIIGYDVYFGTTATPGIIESDLIEIHTGVFANAETEEEQFDELEKIRGAINHAKKLGLGVNAGHGLDYKNMKIFRELEDVDEVSIGHSVIARAVIVGIDEAVREMIRLINFK